MIDTSISLDSTITKLFFSINNPDNHVEPFAGNIETKEWYKTLYKSAIETADLLKEFEKRQGVIGGLLSITSTIYDVVESYVVRKSEGISIDKDEIAFAKNQLHFKKFIHELALQHVLLFAYDELRRENACYPEISSVIINNELGKFAEFNRIINTLSNLSEKNTGSLIKKALSDEGVSDNRRMDHYLGRRVYDFWKEKIYQPPWRQVYFSGNA